MSYTDDIKARIKISKYFERHQAFDTHDALEKMVRQGTLHGLIAIMEDQLEEYRKFPDADPDKIEVRSNILDWLREYYAYTYRIWDAGEYHRNYSYHLTVENARLNEEIRKRDERILMLENILKETDGPNS